MGLEADDGTQRRADALAFATIARQLGQVCRDRDLTTPAFRSPPKHPDIVRSIRHWPGGGVTVAVRVADRPWAEVRDDMVEGVIAAQPHLTTAEKTDLRIQLLAATVTTPEDPAP